jgi:arsenate reductase-like glutaredoxin family protein
MGQRRYLNQNETRDLIYHIAGKGEGYDKYIEWCERNYIQNRFSPAYLHKWVQKKRISIKAARVEHAEEVKKNALADKQLRVSLLEGTVSRLRDMQKVIIDGGHDCPECDKPHVDVDKLLRVEEQLRKTLEAIAKEMGEFNKAPDQSETTSQKLDVILIEMAKKSGLLAAPEPAVQGEYREVE